MKLAGAIFRCSSPLWWIQIGEPGLLMCQISEGSCSAKEFNWANGGGASEMISGNASVRCNFNGRKLCALIIQSCCTTWTQCSTQPMGSWGFSLRIFPLQCFTYQKYCCQHLCWRVHQDLFHPHFPSGQFRGAVKYYFADFVHKFCPKSVTPFSLKKNP